MSRGDLLLVRLFAACVCVITLTPVRLAAQTPTGTISGRVLDAGNLPTPGVTVTITSPRLQGERVTVTSEQGDYIFRLVPPGPYTIGFRLSGFADQRETRQVAAGEPVVVNVTLRPATVSENVVVTADANAFTNTVQAATSISQELLSSLPTARTLLSAVNLAPAVHLTGPSNAVSIHGAMSFENVFMLNGVQIQDNLRGTPFTLFIEDAIQETTIATSGVSAEYGRFTGGVVNAITRSGGNEVSGSFRTTFTNDSWRTSTPFGEPKTDKTVPTYEFTVGGPIVRNRTWFFGAGRFFDQVAARETGFTRIPYEFSSNEKRLEGKVTQKIGMDQTVRASYTGIRRNDVNSAYPSAAEIMDLASLKSPSLPQDLVSIHYSGVFGPRFALEGQFSSRQFTFKNDGALTTDLIDGTVMQDNQTGARWWSPSFCGVCTPEQRDNTNIVVKGSYFLSNKSGAHNVVFGYDTFNDRLTAENHQSGSDYHFWVSGSIDDNGTVYPIVANDFSSFFVWWPILESSLGTNFRTHSLFVNDEWRASNRLTLNLGLRFDKNHGEDATGGLVANDSAFSPRLGVVWDPKGNGRMSLHGSYGRYVAGISNNIASSASPGGQPAVLAYFYTGPNINTNPAAPLVSTSAALGQAFDWFFANGGTNRAPFVANIPGVATQIRESLRSAHADEFSAGVSHQIGSRGSIRVDVVTRQYGDFYTDRIDTTTGQVTDSQGQVFDLALVENTDAVSRQYAALVAQGTYRWNTRLQLGGTYTLSRLWGNVNGENANSGPITSGILSYPEYVDPAWNSPEGDLLADQRHRARIWANVEVPFWSSLGRLSVGLLQQMESGTPYGALGGVRTAEFVPDLGYETPPDSVTYYLKARDAFHTEAMYRTDVALNYSYKLSGARSPEIFAQFQLRNLFNQFSVNNLASGAINTTVLTAVDDPSRFAAFNPFTETPVQGTHWDYGSQFGKAVGAAAYTVPRTFLMSVGVRF